MTPKRHGRGDTGFQSVLADYRHNAFYGKSLSHSHGASEPGFARLAAPTPAAAPEPLPFCGGRRKTCYYPRMRDYIRRLVFCYTKEDAIVIYHILL